MTVQTPKQKSVLFSDFMFNFNKNPFTKDLTPVINEQAVINSLRKILSTNHFEVPYNPFFGANIFHKLFENYTPITESEIKEEIKFAIDNFEPRVNIIDIVINGSPDQESITIVLTFSIINNSNNPITITHTLTRVR